MDFKFYELASNPFVQQPFSSLFWSPSHCEAWQRLVEGVERHRGFIFVLGPSGLGKTALYKAYISQPNPPNLTVLYGIDTTVAFQDLLVSLLQACGLRCATDNLRVVSDNLYQFLSQEYQQGRHTVFLIDDAHTLPAYALQNLCLLADTMQHETGPLLQIVFFGRPTFAQRQDLPQSPLFQLGMARAVDLAPLTRDQSLAYIHHCLKQATPEPRTVFSKSALNLMVKHARGIPQVINIICADVLVAGLLQGEKPISTKTVRGVMGNVTDVGWLPWWRWSLAGTGGLLLIIGLWQLLPPTPNGPQVSPLSQQPRLSTTGAPSVESGPNDTGIPQARTNTQSMAPERLRSQAELQLSQASRPASGEPPTILEPIPVPRDEQSVDEAPSMLMTQGSPRPEPGTPEAPPQPLDPAQEALATAELPRPSPSPNEDNGLIAEQPPASTDTAVSMPRNGTDATRMVCVMPRKDGTHGSDIVVVDQQAEGIHRLIADGAQNLSPVLSPHGLLLAYTSYRDGSPKIYLRDLKTGQEQQLTSGPWLALPGTWSPNGRYLALSQSQNGNYDIFIYDTQRQRLQRLTTSAAVDVSPSFAPDSTRLVFASDRTGSPQLYLTDVTAAPPTRLTQTGPYITSPAWSPHDNTIAFIGRSTDQSLDLYLIQANGTQLRRLTRGQRFHTPPTWAPDGRVLMGMSLRDTKWEQHMVSLTAEGIAAQNLFRMDTPCLAPQWVAQRVP